MRMEAKKAEEWVSELERCWQEGGSPAELKRKLDSAPSDLLRPVDRERLNSLRQRVLARFDQDIALKLEAEFREITDAGRREECLARLERVHVELNGGTK